MSKLYKLKDSIDKLSDSNEQAANAIRSFVRAMEEVRKDHVTRGWKPVCFVSLEEYNWLKANHPELLDKYDIHINYTFEELERLEMWDRIARESERRIKERS